MKKKAVILFMASILALGVLTGCGSSKTETSVTESSVVSEQSKEASVVESSVASEQSTESSVVESSVASEQSKEASVVESSVASEQSTESSVLEIEKTVKVTSVKGITFERPSEWSKVEDSGVLFLFPTNNIYDYIITFDYEDLGSAYKDFEWDKQVVDARTESRKAVMSHGDKFTFTSDEEVIVCGKYARKVSASYNSNDGTEYNEITYMFGNSRYFYVFTNYYKSSNGNTYEKEFENMIKSIEFV